MPGVSQLLMVGSFGLIAHLAAATVPAVDAAPPSLSAAPEARPIAQRRTKECGQEERDDSGCPSGRAMYLVCPSPTPPRFLYCIGGASEENRRE